MLFRKQEGRYTTCFWLIHSAPVVADEPQKRQTSPLLGWCTFDQKLDKLNQLISLPINDRICALVGLRSEEKSALQKIKRRLDSKFVFPEGLSCPSLFRDPSWFSEKLPEGGEGRGSLENGIGSAFLVKKLTHCFKLNILPYFFLL